MKFPKFGTKGIRQTYEFSQRGTKIYKSRDVLFCFCIFYYCIYKNKERDEERFENVGFQLRDYGVFVHVTCFWSNITRYYRKIEFNHGSYYARDIISHDSRKVQKIMTIGNIIVTIIGSSILGSIVTFLLYKRKNVAEVVSIDVNTAAQQVATAMLLVDKYKTEYSELLTVNDKLEKEVEKLREQIDKIADGFATSMQELRKENAVLRQDNEDLQERVRRLEAQVVSLGGKPITIKKIKDGD